MAWFPAQAGKEIKSVVRVPLFEQHILIFYNILPGTTRKMHTYMLVQQQQHRFFWRVPIFFVVVCTYHIIHPTSSARPVRAFGI